MKFAVITSMNQDYYEKYGKLMIRSFEKMWQSYDLYVYNEDFSFKSKNAHMMGWNLGTAYDKFVDRWSSKNKRVVTFAKKAFSIINAMDKIECDRLIWLDADTHCYSRINTQFLELLTPDDTLSTHIGVKHKVDKKIYFSCETGFFILNKNHPQFSLFRDTYKNIYVNDKYENLRRFYDGEVYGETVLKLQEQNAKMIDLNPGHIHKTVFSKSVLAPYLNHYKAGLKDNIDYENLISQLDKNNED